MRQIVFFAIALLFIQSCRNKNVSNYSLDDVSIVIDFDAVKYDSLKLSKIKFIPLETSRECIIGRVDKTLIKNDKIYVADFYQTKSLFVFDLNGKLLFKIAKMGQGPGEYLRLNDFDVNSNGDIYILDNHSKKMKIYDSEGEHLRDFVLDDHLTRFCLAGNKIYLSKLYDGVIFANLAIYDTTTKQTEIILDDELFLYNLPERSYGFLYSPNRMYYSPKLSEIIYSLDEKGAHPAIGIKNLKIPPKNIVDEWAQEDDLGLRKIEGSNYFLETVCIYETHNHIVMECLMGNSSLSKTILYNKQSKNVSFVRNSDYFFKTGSSAIEGSTGTDFFATVSFNSRNQFHEKFLDSYEELANWQEDDNPVVVIFNY